jgi:hypothetical protein
LLDGLSALVKFAVEVQARATSGSGIGGGFAFAGIRITLQF